MDEFKPQELSATAWACGKNGRAPSKELDALCELLGDRYEPHLRALPYAFAGDAAAGARSLKYHAEKKAKRKG